MNKNEAQKNTLPSYGLTIVAGLPLSDDITSKIVELKDEIGSILPIPIKWYALNHLHVTLAAPLRGRYRQQPPIRRNELPVDLVGFIHDLTCYFRQIQPFSIELAGPILTDGGVFLIKATSAIPIQRNLISILQKYPELDHPETKENLHLTIGYIMATESIQPFIKMESSTRKIDKLYKPSIDKMMVKQVWLIHYSNRTLNQVVGKFAFPLGRLISMNVERFLVELGISP